MTHINYLAVIHKDSDSDFGIAFPDFPGCVSGGETIEETILEGTKALHSHIQALIACGNPIPEPRDFSSLFNHDLVEGGMVVSVPYFPPAETKRINMTIREDHLKTIDRIAELVGKTRSAFMVEASLVAAARVERHAKVSLVKDNLLAKPLPATREVAEIIKLDDKRLQNA